MPGIPKSVAALNKWPYPFAKYKLGTRFYEWVQLLRNLFDNDAARVLGNPTVIQNTGGGGAVDLEISVAFDYEIDGQVYTKAITQDINLAAGAATGAGEYKAVRLSIDAAGTLTQTVSDAADAAPVPVPDTPAGECSVAAFQIPVSVTPGVTNFETAWVSNGDPGRTTAVKPEALPDTDI